MMWHSYGIELWMVDRKEPVAPDHHHEVAGVLQIACVVGC